MGYSLLHLMAAVSTCETDNHLQLLGGIVDKLLFKGSLFRFGGPGQPLVKVQQPVHAQGNRDKLPAHCPPNLKKRILHQLTTVAPTE